MLLFTILFISCSKLISLNNIAKNEPKAQNSLKPNASKQAIDSFSECSDDEILLSLSKILQQNTIDPKILFVNSIKKDRLFYSSILLERNIVSIKEIFKEKDGYFIDNYGVILLIISNLSIEALNLLDRYIDISKIRYLNKNLIFHLAFQSFCGNLSGKNEENINTFLKCLINKHISFSNEEFNELLNKYCNKCYSQHDENIPLIKQKVLISIFSRHTAYAIFNNQFIQNIYLILQYNNRRVVKIESYKLINYTFEYINNKLEKDREVGELLKESLTFDELIDFFIKKIQKYIFIHNSPFLQYIREKEVNLTKKEFMCLANGHLKKHFKSNKDIIINEISEAKKKIVPYYSLAYILSTREIFTNNGYTVIDEYNSRIEVFKKLKNDYLDVE